MRLPWGCGTSIHGIPDNHFVVQNQVRGPDELSIIRSLVENIGEVGVRGLVVHSYGGIGESGGRWPVRIVETFIHPIVRQDPVQGIKGSPIGGVIGIAGRRTTGGSAFRGTGQVLDGSGIKGLRLPFAACGGHGIAICILECSYQSSVAGMIRTASVGFCPESKSLFPIRQLSDSGGAIFVAGPQIGSAIDPSPPNACPTQAT